jgi:hypothetical protein
VQALSPVDSRAVENDQSRYFCVIDFDLAVCQLLRLQMPPLTAPISERQGKTGGNQYSYYLEKTDILGSQPLAKRSHERALSLFEKQSGAMPKEACRTEAVRRVNSLESN